jgi:hypothetical protein
MPTFNFSEQEYIKQIKMPTLQKSLEFLSVIGATSLNSQSAHRFHLFQSWLKIAQENGYDLESNIVGKQTLDIGCGQGDMIALFAAVLKVQGNKESKVIGVDPASLDYGEFVEPHSFQTAPTYGKANPVPLATPNLVSPPAVSESTYALSKPPRQH